MWVDTGLQCRFSDSLGDAKFLNQNDAWSVFQVSWDDQVVVSTTINGPSKAKVARLLYLPLKLDQAGKEFALRQSGSAAKTVPKGGPMSQ